MTDESACGGPACESPTVFDAGTTGGGHTQSDDLRVRVPASLFYLAIVLSVVATALEFVLSFWWSR